MKNIVLLSLALSPLLALGDDTRFSVAGHHARPDIDAAHHDVEHPHELRIRQGPIGSLLSSIITGVLPPRTSPSPGTSSADDDTSTPPTDPPSTPTNDPEPSTPAPPTEPTTPPPQTSQPPATSADDSSTAGPASTAPAESSDDNQVTLTIPADIPRKTITMVLTNSAGETSVATLVSISGSPSLVDANSLATGASRSGTERVTSSQKKIIIGCTVGIGGFLVLLGIAGIFWRIWGRRGKGDAARDDPRLPRSPISGNESVEQYQKPVNQSANF